MKIYTITLNPAFDLHCRADGFRPFCENAVQIICNQAGGKGINISRALNAYGVDNSAVAVTGRENSAEFLREIERDGIKCVAVEADGRIRENITLHTEGLGETRISFSGFSVGREVLEAVCERLSGLGKGDIVTLTGRNPDGIDINDVKTFCKRLKDTGARLVIDSKSFGIDDLVEVGAWLIKPNYEEVSAYLGKKNADFDEILTFASNVCKKGIENVVVSLGGDGAILCRADGNIRADAPKIQPVSTVGAGDSMIAGFISAEIRGASPTDCLRTAVAFGSAACLTAGTCPPVRADIDRLAELVGIEVME